MGLQTIKRGLVIPQWPDAAISAPNTAALTTDANDEVAAIICRAPKTGNVRAIWSVMQIGSGADRTIGLFTVDLTTGTPTTPPTPYATNSFAIKTLAAGDSNDMVSSGNFGSDCPVVKGALLAVCWIAPASSPGNILISTYADWQPLFPYRALYTGSWAKSAGSGIVLFEYDDGSMEVPFGCLGSGDASGSSPFVTATFNNTSTPDVVGARFKFTVPVRVNSVWVWADFDANANIYLVDEAWDGTALGALASAAIDSDVRAVTNGGAYLAELSADVVLAANTYYRLVVEPTSGSNLSLYYYTCASAAQLAAQPLGVNFHYTSAKDPNDNTDWTNFDNGTDGYRVPLMGLVVDQFDDGAAGGGGGFHSVFGGSVVR